MAINRPALALAQQLRDQLDLVLDAQTRDLVAAWIRAWDEVAADVEAALHLLVATAAAGDVVPRALMVRNARLQNALAHVAERLDDLADAAGIRIVGDLQEVVDQAAGLQAAIVSAQFPTDDRPRLESSIDAAALDAIIQRSSEQITAATYPIADDAYDVVRRELVRGITIGASPRHTADRMLARAEQGFNGGLARALTISRTETLDAHRAAAHAGQEQHVDVLAGWVWLAELDPRMCPACAGMHGRLFPLTEPGPLGHQQCRCARMPKTKTWADLGIDLDEPADAVPDADAWFDALTPAEQRRLLGRERYDAWVAGEFPREQWATRQSNDGWRDSFVPAKPGDPAAGSNMPPNQPPTPPAARPGAGDPEDWQARQDALPVDFHGETLEPHEVAFVERFLAAGEQLEWIPKDTKTFRPTNDFIWLNNDGLPIELKSSKAKASTIFGRILTAVRKAQAQDVVKENFIIDLGEQPLTDELRDELAGYNEGRRLYRIARLWVMTRGVLKRIALR